MRFFCLLTLASWLPMAALAKLNVVATTPDFGVLAQEIGGQRVTVTTLAKPTEDPHFVDPKPSFIVKLSRADALLEGGAELEIGWLPPLLQGARNNKLAPGQPGRIVCSEGIEMLEVPAELDRSHGDIHSLGNPHFLPDPLNGRIVAGHLCEAFSKLDPAGQETFRANLRQFEERLDSKMAEWQKLLAPHRQQRVVAYHDYWIYFARRFGLRIDLFLEPKPGIPPSPAHLAEVVTQMKNEHIRVILVQPYVSRKTAETAARLAGGMVVEMDPFPGAGQSGGEDYISWVDGLVRTLAKALEQGR